MKELIRKYLKESFSELEVRVKFPIDLPKDIIAIKDVFTKNKKKLYLVGGCVRDAILNKKPKDFDLATEATPDEVESILNDAGYRTIPTGKAFGVINVITNNDEYEIATFRKDSEYSDSRRPDSVEFTDIKTDALRRDLTLNALYYDISTKEIIDFVGGIDDIKKGIVRTVGSPVDRFNEDRLRILRSIRFAARFGSNLEPNVDLALSKDSSLKGISKERIRDEFIKGIKSAKSVIFFFQLLEKYKLFDWIFPGLDINMKFIEEKNHIVSIANILKYNNPELLRKKLNELTYSTEEVSKIVFLIRFLKFNPDEIYQFKKLQEISKIDDDELIRFGIENGINSNLVNSFINFKLTVSGDDMIKKGIKPGPDMGIAIKNAEIENFKKILTKN